MTQQIRGGGSVVVDASLFVDLLCENAAAPEIRHRLEGDRMIAPGHFDAEVLSALGRLQRAGRLTDRQVEKQVAALARAPISRRPLPPLLAGAWRRRDNLRLVDALYVELCAQLGDVPLLTRDAGQAGACKTGELVATQADAR